MNMIEAQKVKNKKKQTSHKSEFDPQLESGGYKPIENYGVIGDLHTVALVAMDGSIDWCCLPHFNSPSVFGTILDARKGGFFKITALNHAVCKQMYLPETCILVTRFLNKDGIAELTDFMTIDDEAEKNHRHQIIRTVRGISGCSKIRMECAPAFDYARAEHQLSLRDEGAVFSTPGIKLGLTSSRRLKGKGGRAYVEFDLKEGQEESFILREVGCSSGEKLIDSAFDVNAAFQQTVSYWRKWVSGIKYQGRWREMVQRSAMTLKLLTYRPTGAILAAPTTSLPETIGGTRNFDYRYTWIRDAAFTVYAFLRLGLTHEAEQFVSWIDARAHEEKKDGSLQIMYGINGEHEINEQELTHLEGYRRSRPVRIGNHAHRQLQLDIYGELMDAIYLSNKYSKPVSYDLWTHLQVFLDYVCHNWKRKDAGLWEVRGGNHQFVFSKLMCWVALDRGIRLSEKRSFPGDRQKWYQVRDEIYETIMAKGWNKKVQSFVQHFDSEALDASNLLMPLVFFIAPTDPRMLSTIKATMNKLVTDSLVHRYDSLRGAQDGFSGREGSFSMCTFWLVEALTRG
jgi:GH15 family glucan-1,4-alpha-glucosidase